MLRWLWGWQRFQAAFGCGIGSLKTLWVVGQDNFYAQACGEVLAVAQNDATAVALGDGLGDGEPEPCALFVAAEYAVEGIKYALAFGGRDAVAVVFDDEDGAALPALGGQVYLAASWGVADGVVGEGFDKGVEVYFANGQAGVVGAGYADVLVFGLGEGVEVLDDALEDGLDGDGWGLRLFRVGLLGAGLAAGEGEQLFLQLVAALDGGFQAAYLFFKLGREIVFAQAFGLQA